MFAQVNRTEWPIIPNLMAQLLPEVDTLLRSRNVDFETRRNVGKHCVEIIRHQLHILSSVNSQFLHPQRMDGVVVGMLYLLRAGVVCKGVTALPRVSILAQILPSECNLADFFGYRAKVITDTENMIKKCLRADPRQVLNVYTTPHERLGMSG